MKLSPLFFFLALAFLGSVIPSFTEAATLSRPANNLGLQAYWSFDEGAGTVVVDHSGKGNNGSFVNTSTWVGGKRGKAIMFNGTSSYIRVPNSSSLNPTNLTVSVWAKSNTSTWNDYGFLMSKRNVFVVHPQQNSTGINFYIYTTGWTSVSCTPTTAITNWNLYSFTWNGTNLTAYINGVQCGTTTPVGPINTSDTNPLYIGYDTGTRYFNGSEDDIRIYSRALSATEIAALYTQGEVVQKIIPRSGLMGEWKFDEGTSTQAHDSSAFVNAAALVNGSTWVSGKHGKAVQLDGNTQYVSIPDSTALNNGSMSASMWFTLTSEIDCDAGNNYRMLLNKNTGTAGWRVVLEQNKQPQFDVWPGGVQSRSGGVSVGLQIGVPILLTFTYDATTGNQQVWANGVLKSTKVNTPASLGTSPIALTLGKGGTTGTCPASGNGYTPGTYDDVRIYNRALSASEIQALYREQAATINSSKNGKMTNGLVALLSFDGADIQGSTAYDRSGNGNNGTLTSSPRPSIGKIGQALSFDGAATYIAMSGNPASLQLSQGTVSAWIKTSNAGTSYRGIVSKASAYGMYLMGNIFGVYDNGAPAFRSTGVNLADNKWHHVSFSFDSGVTNGTLLYIDGVLVLTTTLTNTSQATNVQVSRGQGGASQIFNGAIDDVRIYNRILPASEIKQLYNMGK